MHSIDEVDLRELADRLRKWFEHHPPIGYLGGKTQLRDAVEASLACSELKAEELVDSLELQHLIEFEGDPALPSEVDAPWIIH